MSSKYADYSLFLNIFDAYSRAGLEGIDQDDPMMIELDRLMDMNTQLFYIADVILLDILYISKGVVNMFGMQQDKVSAGFFLTTTHPDDLKRHHLVRSKLLSIAQEIYIQKEGKRFISSNFRARKPEGGETNLLYQAYVFYSKIPYESTFLILVITDISKFTKIHKGFHFYMGDDRKYFRFPDEELLMSGMMFSNTEFRIIELIEEGFTSNEIAQKLFRSIYTINTHRTNILNKSGRSSIAEVIRDLKANGLL